MRRTGAHPSAIRSPDMRLEAGAIVPEILHRCVHALITLPLPLK